MSNMINVRDEAGDVAGRFDTTKAQKVASSRTNSSFAWSELYKTKGGKWVLASITCYEGQRDAYRYIEQSAAMNFFTDYGLQADAGIFFDINKFEEEV